MVGWAKNYRRGWGGGRLSQLRQDQTQHRSMHYLATYSREAAVNFPEGTKPPQIPALTDTLLAEFST